MFQPTYQYDELLGFRALSEREFFPLKESRAVESSTKSILRQFIPLAESAVLA